MAGMANFFSWAYLKSCSQEVSEDSFELAMACRAAYGLDVLTVDDTGLLENFLGRHFG